MKEMTIEQKAKAYDKAIEHARSLLKTIGNATLGNLVLKNEFKNMFPALEESEDERIRKTLIKYFRNCVSLEGINGEDISNWLEKQGEQKPAKWDVAAIAKLADEYYDTLIKESNMSYNMATHCKLAFFHGADAMLKKTQCEQEPWNEEDKNMLKWITGYLDNKMLNTPIVEERTACKNAIAWLEKLKDEQKPADVSKQEDIELTEFEDALYTTFSDIWQDYMLGKEINVVDFVREHSDELLKIANKQKPTEWSEEDMKVNVEKLICFLMSDEVIENNIPESLKLGLEQQGLKCKDGKIHSISEKERSKKVAQSDK